MHNISIKLSKSPHKTNLYLLSNEVFVPNTCRVDGKHQ